MDRFDVAIIGSGVGGMSVALELKKNGLNICVVDEKKDAGGEFVRYGEIKPENPSPVSYKNGLEIVSEFEKLDIKYLKKSELIFIDNEKQVIVKTDDENLVSIKAKNIILATGAREVVSVFPGWDLPGVITTGAMQILLKIGQRPFAKKAVIAGRGILLYAACSTWVSKGGVIEAFCDGNSFSDKTSMLMHVIQNREKREDFISLFPYMRKFIFKSKNGYSVIRANGEKKLQSVDIGRLDKEGNVIKSSIKNIKTSFLAIGDGFVGNIEAGLLAGCKSTYDKNLGGFVLDVSEDLQTTVDGIYALGALNGIGGIDKSRLDGKIISNKILHEEQIIDKQTYNNNKLAFMKAKDKSLKFTKLLSKMQNKNALNFKSLDRNTTICRCENIKLHEIQKAIDSGFTSLNSIKKATRATMGNCQGKTCQNIIQNILLSQNIKIGQNISIRPPLRATSISLMAKDLVEFSPKKENR